MRKVFAFIGSPLKEKSNTYILTRMMLDRLVEMNNEISCDVYTAGHVNLQYCRGCWSCMTRGSCPTDRTDDMGMLREKMMGADFIIFGSPVYVLNVSGQMKVFLDRLAAWFHSIRLAGKPGMTVSTTLVDGLEIIHKYLRKALFVLGVKLVTKLDTFGGFPATFANPEEAKKSALKAAEEVYPYVMGEKVVESCDDMEEVFNMMKQESIDDREKFPGIYGYWEKQGMIEIDSYAELLERIRKKEIILT